jgi:hypothetical protein
MSHDVCGRKSEWKMLISQLSAPLLVEIMAKGGIFFTFFGSFTAQD